MSPEAPSSRFRLAAIQDHASPAWKSFYPEDLPSDWVLAYYAHFWRELLVPAHAWQTWLEDRRWLDEAPEGLRLYFQVPDGCGNEGLELASRFGARLGGLLFPDAAADVPAQVQPSRVFRRMPDPVFADVRCALAFACGQATVLVLDPETGLDPRQWRGLLEAVHAATASARDALVFLRTGPDELDQAQTILRLSGLAWRQD